MPQFMRNKRMKSYFWPRTSPMTARPVRIARANPVQAAGRPILWWVVVKPSTTSPNGYVLANPKSDPFEASEADAAMLARNTNIRYRAARATDFFHRITGQDRL